MSNLRSATHRKAMAELEVGNHIIRVGGYKRLIGVKYKVLSISSTSTYLQNLDTNRCHSVPNRFIPEDFAKVSKECLHRNAISEMYGYMYCPDCNEAFEGEEQLC